MKTIEKIMARLGWVRVSTMAAAVEETAMDEARERAFRRDAEKRAVKLAGDLRAEQRVVEFLLSKMVDGHALA